MLDREEDYSAVVIDKKPGRRGGKVNKAEARGYEDIENAAMEPYGMNAPTGAPASFNARSRGGVVPQTDPHRNNMNERSML